MAKSIKEIRLKRCRICGRPIRSYNKSGLCSYCLKEEWRKKPEVKERNRKYNQEYYKRNKERILESRKEYSKRPEVKERKKEYMKRYDEKKKQTTEEM